MRQKLEETDIVYKNKRHSKELSYGTFECFKNVVLLQTSLKNLPNCSLLCIDFSSLLIVCIHIDNSNNSSAKENVAKRTGCLIKADEEKHLFTCLEQQ